MAPGDDAPQTHGGKTRSRSLLLGGRNDDDRSRDRFGSNRQGHGRPCRRADIEARPTPGRPPTSTRRREERSPGASRHPYADEVIRAHPAPRRPNHPAFGGNVLSPSGARTSDQSNAQLTAPYETADPGQRLYVRRRLLPVPRPGGPGVDPVRTPAFTRCGWMTPPSVDTSESRGAMPPYTARAAARSRPRPDRALRPVAPGRPTLHGGARAAKAAASGRAADDGENRGGR